jgi:hypothetical protein
MELFMVQTSYLVQGIWRIGMRRHVQGKASCDGPLPSQTAEGQRKGVAVKTAKDPGAFFQAQPPMATFTEPSGRFKNRKMGG